MIRHLALIMTLVAFSPAAQAAKTPSLASPEFLHYAIPRMMSTVKSNAESALELALSAGCYVGIEKFCHQLAGLERRQAQAALLAGRSRPATPLSGADARQAKASVGTTSDASARQRAERACTRKRGAGCREWAELESRAGEKETARRLFTLACAYGDGVACGRIAPRDAREIARASHRLTVSR